MASPVAADLPQEIVVVSGLPRSGTSMMMQMLAAAGMPVATDDERPPDPSNPFGYFEYAPVRRIVRDASWMEALTGQAVKVVAPLVRHLPAQHRYRVIFMLRDLEAVLLSQQRMLERLGTEASPAPGLGEGLFAAQQASLRHCETMPQASLLRIHYEETVAKPLRAARRIAAFLAPWALDPAPMAGAVRPPPRAPA
ncbi:MAG: sulfotransferase family protein [Deltaproteobacteria bacterium]|nr:MAG: sulfotransferase family protein [Deltaproteobacteria bacterium]